MAAREAYSLYVERAVEGANEADGPFSSLWRGYSGTPRLPRFGRAGPCPERLERGFMLRACEVTCYSHDISVFSENPAEVPERKR